MVDSGFSKRFLEFCKDTSSIEFKEPFTELDEFLDKIMTVNNKHLPDTMLLLEQGVPDKAWDVYQFILTYVVIRDLKKINKKFHQRHLISASGLQRHKAWTALEGLLP